MSVTTDQDALYKLLKNFKGESDVKGLDCTPSTGQRGKSHSPQTAVY